MKISEKSYDKEAGKIRVKLRNESGYQTVTAFGVVLVYSRVDGGGGTQVKSREMLPGDGIAPGATFEMEFDLGPADPANSSAGTDGLQAIIHYEILSDTSSHGNRAYIDSVFESRAIYLNELERTLARVQSLRSRVTEKNTHRFWVEEAERREKAVRALSNMSNIAKNTTRRDRSRWKAVVETTDLSLQVKKSIDNGRPAQDALKAMESLLQEHLLKPISMGVRRSDLLQPPAVGRFESQRLFRDRGAALAL